MDGIINSFINFIKLTPKYLFVVFVTGIIFLFLPDDLAMKLGILHLRYTYHGWLVTITIAAFIMCLVQVMLLIVSWIQQKFITYRVKLDTLSCLDTLSHKEREYLCYCIYKNQQTITPPLYDPISNSLHEKGICIRENGIGDITEWPSKIPNYVWNYLQKNKKKYFPELFNENELKKLKNKYGPN